MQQWSDEDTSALKEIKRRLQTELDAQPRYKEVIGDRKLLRFYNGHQRDIDKACEMITKFFSWREAKGVNAIRSNIVERGMCHPSMFPKADVILKLFPQIVINPDMKDNTGSPLCLEQYNFYPHDVLQHCSLDDYIIFQIYCLEYKSLILEQLSEDAERKHLEERKRDIAKGCYDFAKDAIPYGKMLHTCIVRDLNGIGMAHLGREGQEIVRSVMSVASDNYPEMMHKCHIVNAPWVFNTAWWVIKGWMSPRTVDKVSVMGSSFLTELTSHIDVACLPQAVGGEYPTEHEQGRPFVFDLSQGGLLWME